MVRSAIRVTKKNKNNNQQKRSNYISYLFYCVKYKQKDEQIILDQKNSFFLIQNVKHISIIMQFIFLIYLFYQFLSLLGCLQIKSTKTKLKKKKIVYSNHKMLSK